jgi:hypothetical protein
LNTANLSFLEPVIGTGWTLVRLKVLSGILHAVRLFAAANEEDSGNGEGEDNVNVADEDDNVNVNATDDDSGLSPGMPRMG